MRQGIERVDTSGRTVVFGGPLRIAKRKAYVTAREERRQVLRCNLHGIRRFHQRPFQVTVPLQGQRQNQHRSRIVGRSGLRLLQVLDCCLHVLKRQEQT